MKKVWNQKTLLGRIQRIFHFRNYVKWWCSVERSSLWDWYERFCLLSKGTDDQTLVLSQTKVVFLSSKHCQAKIHHVALILKWCALLPNWMGHLNSKNKDICHKVTCSIKRIVTNKLPACGLGNPKHGLVARQI